MSTQLSLFGETREERESQGGGGGPSENTSTLQVHETIKEFVPASWFHPVGIFKVLARFWDRLPDVSEKLFLTFTLDPKNYASEEAAFDDSRERLRKVFFRLRHGVEHEGRTYTIDAPYCIKVEFHESGWVHYHAVFLTRRFLPKELLAELWSLGWVKVQRITSADFHYLLKYITKPDELPEWVKQRKRLRVFQTTKGFLKPAEKSELVAQPTEPDPFAKKRRRASYSIGERFSRWACMAVIRGAEKVRTVRFQLPFRELFDHLVWPAALDGCYLGGGEIVMRGKGVMSEWIRMQNKLLRNSTGYSCAGS